MNIDSITQQRIVAAGLDVESVIEKAVDLEFSGEDIRRAFLHNEVQPARSAYWDSRSGQDDLDVLRGVGLSICR